MHQPANQQETRSHVNRQAAGMAFPSNATTRSTICKCNRGSCINISVEIEQKKSNSPSNNDDRICVHMKSVEKMNKIYMKKEREKKS